WRAFDVHRRLYPAGEARRPKPPERFARGPGRGRVPLHPDRQLSGIAAPARGIAPGEYLPANKLLAVRAGSGGLSTLVRTFDKPMGRAAAGGRLALGTRQEVWFLRNAPDIAPRVEPAGRHDACFVPRSAHVTGDIAVHELAWAGEELWVV